ncbi:MAG: hypothetical protein KGH85_03025 [Thaumarchaeota archaeon]|nr:hypothetical protein [Nitrososphaerota archaeon]
MDDKTINLTVLDAYTRDVGRAVARIDPKSMDVIGVSTGDILEISRKQRSVARCLPLYPTDNEKGIIRIDGLGRNNTGAEVGSTITVRKIETMPAEKITVLALDSIPPMDERYLASALENMPVTKNDNIMVPYFGSRLAFQIVDTTPNTDVIIEQKTLFTITRKTSGLMTTQNARVYQMTRHDSKTLARLKSVVEQYEKKVSEKQEEIKNITHEMIKENHQVDEIKKFLNSTMHENLLVLHEKLLNAYRQYVMELESETSGK